jgi:DNA-binding transcriptional regulator YiaG
MDQRLRQAGVLETAPEKPTPRSLVMELREAYQLSDEAIAAATGADKRTVLRWRAQKEFSRASKYDQPLADLVQILREMARLLPPSLIERWLVSPNAFLDGAVPSEVLGAGQIDKIHTAVARALAGDRPEHQRVATRRAGSDPSEDAGAGKAARRREGSTA